jgi:hypothetical protein
MRSAGGTPEDEIARGPAALRVVPMVSDETYRGSQPPFRATFATLWIAGAVSSAVLAALPIYGFVHSWTAGSVYRVVLGAAIGGAVVRAALPRLAGAEISYPGAAFAVGIGGGLGTLVQLVWLGETARHAAAAGPWLTTISVAGSLVASVASLAGTILAYQVVVALARPRGARATETEIELGLAWGAADTSHPAVLPLPEPPRERPVRTWLDVALADVRRAVVTAVGEIGEAAAIDFPSRVLEALSELATCTRTLRQGEVDDPQVRSGVERLVDGLERFQTSISTLGTPAIEGARLRYELEHADGLATIGGAFEEIDALQRDAAD